MSDIERIMLELEIKGLKQILDFHIEGAKIHGFTSEKQAYIDDILDILNDYLKILKDNENE